MPGESGALTTINEVKELEQTYTPLVLVEFVFSDGTGYNISPISIRQIETGVPGLLYNANEYTGRLLNSDLAATQALSANGLAMAPSVNLQIADPDGSVFQLYEIGKGFKGALAKLRFVFWNAFTGSFSSNFKYVFQGTCNAAIDAYGSFTVAAVSLLAMSKQELPLIHIQKSCPWFFPSSAADKAQANNPDSRFYNCGNDNPANPTCDRTKANCVTNTLVAGPTMYAKGRFGGFQWLPPDAWRGRPYIADLSTGGKNATVSLYSEYVPIQYGSGWIDAFVLNVIGDANYTQGEALLCYGQIPNNINGQSRLPTTVRVEGYDLTWAPGLGERLNSQTKNGFWHWVSDGSRDGRPNDDKGFKNLGDPYGSMCVIHWAALRQVAESTSIPRVRVKFGGPKIRAYTNKLDLTQFTMVGPIVQPPDNQAQTNNRTPAWVLLDLLKNAGWSYDEVDLVSFIDAASLCDTQLSYTDQHGVTQTHARFRGSLSIRTRRAISDVIASYMRSFRAYLVVGDKLELRIRGTLGQDQPDAPTVTGSTVAGTNYPTGIVTKLLDGTTGTGYAAYWFSDTNNTIKRNPDGTLAVRLSQAQNADIPNHMGFQFQDEDNDYVTGAFLRLDDQDLARLQGVENLSSIQIDGINNYDQGKRIIKTMMAEAMRGNPRSTAANGTSGTWELTITSSVRILHLRIGHIVIVTLAHYGISKQQFRITEVKPSLNFEEITVKMRWHEDLWYTDAYGQLPDPTYSNSYRNQLSRPSLPWTPYEIQAPASDSFAPLEWTFGLYQQYEKLGDGSIEGKLVIGGKIPVNSFTSQTNPPFVKHDLDCSATGGTIDADRDVYACLVAKDTASNANFGVTAPSYIAKGHTPAGANTCSFTIPRVVWQPNSQGYQLFAGYDVQDMRFISEANVITATSFTITSIPPINFTYPDVEFDKFRVKGKKLWHAGVWGQGVDAVSGSSITIVDAGWTVNQWAGRSVIVLGSVSGQVTKAEMPLWRFTVASNTIDTLTFSGSPDLSKINVNDAIVMRAKATAVTATTIQDTNWVNTLGERKGITAASNTAPIVIEQSNHNRRTGASIVVAGVEGNTAANGTFTITVIDEDHYSLDGSTGNAAYTIGGTAQNRGLNPGEEAGRLVYVIAGKGFGQSVMILDNTIDTLTVKNWPLEIPDTTSTFIIEAPTWEVSVDSNSLSGIKSPDDTSIDPLKPPIQMELPVSNYAGVSMRVEVFTVDGSGDPSLYGPWREVFIYGFNNNKQEDFETLTVVIHDSTVGVDVANHLPIRRTGFALDIICVAKIAPLGVAFQANIKVNGVAMTVTPVSIPAGSPVNAEFVYSNFVTNPFPLVANGDTSDIVTVDIVGSDGACEVTLVLRWRVATNPNPLVTTTSLAFDLPSNSANILLIL